MDRYDPEVAPAPEQWLAAEEMERLLLVEAYHNDPRVDIPKAQRRLHASIHVVVENQLAANDEPVVRALARLMNGGLSRHDAVHAIGCAVSETIYERVKLKEDPSTANARYYAAVERLTAEVWREEYGED
ncbi:MAG: hypothetical protein ACT4P4_26965 [Betaproteobacteria bacterium]